MKNIKLRVYTFLNAVCLLVLFLMMVEMFVPTRIPLADYGTPLGLMLLLILIPAACIFLGRLTKEQLKTRHPAFKTYYQVSKVFILAMWIVSWGPILFYGAIVLNYMNWPFLESNQGPDTKDAIEGFTRTFHAPPQSGVSQIYFRENPDMVLLRFTLNDRDRLRHIVKSYKLHKTSRCRLNLSSPPDWWQPPTEKSYCYSDSRFDYRQGTHQLAYETKTGTVHFMRFDP